VAGFLNNPWVIGIGGGVLSGIVVTLLSRFLLSRRENREYLQRVASANREVVYAVRPGISEGVLPGADVVDALIEATARRHAVEKKDLFSSSEVAQELIKEVMDSSFISAKTKDEYCRQLNSLNEPAPAQLTGPEAEQILLLPRAQTPVAAYRERTTMLVSTMMGIMTAFMSVVVAVALFAEKSISAPLLGDALSKFAPAALSSVGVVASLLVAFGVREFVHKVEIRGRRSEASHASRETKPGDNDGATS
jgi:hypothetical protein